MIRRLPDDSEFRMTEREKLMAISGLNRKPAKISAIELALGGFIIGFCVVTMAVVGIAIF